MIGIPPRRGATVMAGDTTANDVTMIDARRQPALRDVAGTALVTGDNMRSMLAFGYHAIMTTGASAGNRIVIKAR